MVTSLTITAILAFSSVVTAGAAQRETDLQAKPEHQVMAYYFHRTVRCPTCKRIGGMAEDAVKKGFVNEIKERTIGFQFVDFQDEKNAKLVKSYGVEAPTLILLNVYDGETVCWTPMPKVWQLVGKPDEFREYVHGGVVRYLKQNKEDAQKEREKAKESQQ